MSKCTIDDCNNPVRAKGLCSKHYERKRVHGDVHADFRTKLKKVCRIADCGDYTVGDGLCAKHYARRLRTGSTDSQRPTYGSNRIVHRQGYIRIRVNGKYILEHVLMAEKALGKPLPLKAVVHHVNENTGDNKTPFNLVICPNQAYHFLLHKRARELKEFGRCISTDYNTKVKITLAELFSK